MRLPLPVRVAAAAALLGVGCAQVLGIEEATLDPTIGAPPLDAGVPTCDRYCDVVQRNCAGPLEQYPTRDTCLSTCALLPVGTLGDSGGNTVGCRLRYAESAGEFEAAVNCPAAGPAGNGICGTNCEGFCTIALAACDTTLFTVDTCAGACTRLRDLGTYDDSMQTGPEVQCRVYHATVASRDPEVHCQHAAGAPPCR